MLTVKYLSFQGWLKYKFRALPDDNFRKSNLFEIVLIYIFMTYTIYIFGTYTRQNQPSTAPVQEDLGSILIQTQMALLDLSSPFFQTTDLKMISLFCNIVMSS